MGKKKWKIKFGRKGMMMMQIRIKTLTYFRPPVQEFPSDTGHKKSESDTKAHIHDEFKYIFLIK